MFVGSNETFFKSENPALRTICDFMLQILKLGGSVITDKNKYITPRKKAIRSLVREIISAREEKDFRLILVNGAGSFGHMPVKKYGLENGIRDEKTKIGMAMVHKFVEDLNRIIWEEFLKNNVSAVPVHPMSFIVHDDGNIVLFETKQIEKMLDMNIIPLLYGDVVVDLKRGCSIISGDDIVPYLAKKLNADKILMGTDTDGIFDKNPKLFRDAKLIRDINNKNYEDVLSMVSSSASVDVTGGMRDKLKKMIDIAGGIESLVYNANRSGLTKRVLLGEKLGTSIFVS